MNFSSSNTTTVQNDDIDLFRLCLGFLDETQAGAIKKKRSIDPAKRSHTHIQPDQSDIKPNLNSTFVRFEEDNTNENNECLDNDCLDKIDADCLHYKWVQIIKEMGASLKENLAKLDYSNLIEETADFQQALLLHTDQDLDETLTTREEPFDFKCQLIKSLNVHFLKDLRDFTPKTFYADMLMANNNESYLIVISLLKDKIYQLYVDQMRQYEWMVRRAIRYIYIIFLFYHFRGPKVTYKNCL